MSTRVAIIAAMRRSLLRTVTRQQQQGRGRGSLSHAASLHTYYSTHRGGIRDDDDEEGCSKTRPTTLPLRALQFYLAVGEPVSSGVSTMSMGRDCSLWEILAVEAVKGGGGLTMVALIGIVGFAMNSFKNEIKAEMTALSSKMEKDMVVLKSDMNTLGSKIDFLASSIGGRLDNQDEKIRNSVERQEIESEKLRKEMEHKANKKKFWKFWK